MVKFHTPPPGGRHPEYDWEEALDLGHSILDDLEELPERAEDFAASVEEKVRDILATIELGQHCTPGQWQALENLAAGVRRWLER
jgi:hypothetical protein